MFPPDMPCRLMPIILPVFVLFKPLVEHLRATPFPGELLHRGNLVGSLSEAKNCARALEKKLDELEPG